MNQQNSSFFLDSVTSETTVKQHLLCVHGLNQNPQALKPILQDLADIGIFCHLLHLPGHLNDNEINHNVTEEMIVESYSQAYSHIQALSKEHGVPMGFFGYSFGGLIGTWMLKEFHMNKMILLAPALKLRLFTHGIRPVLPMLSRVYSLPLGHRRMEERYRFHHNGVPKAVYESFFEIYDQFQSQKDKNKTLSKTQALVFAHPRDELVSYKGLGHWLKKNSNWQLRPLSNHNAEFGRYKHLIFDETTLGKDSYESLFNDITKFLLK